MTESNKKFLPISEEEELAKDFISILGEQDNAEQRAALAALVNDFLTKKYANINTSERKGVYSLGPDGQLRKH